MADLKELSSTEMFGGLQKIFSHNSQLCKCPMKFGIYIPPVVYERPNLKVPVLYSLTGLNGDVEGTVALTWTQEHAAAHGLVVVVPDTSPRKTGIPGEADPAVAFGHGAAFYFDATTPGWKEHYQMFSYVTDELISTIENSFDFVQKGMRGMSGGSMGGHGALICALKKPHLYDSVSSVFPISNPSSMFKVQPSDPSDTQDKRSALEIAFGPNPEIWKQWDAFELMKSYQGRNMDILVHTAACDMLWDVLQQWQLVKGCKDKTNINLRLKVISGHGHDIIFSGRTSYEIVKYHADILCR